MEIALSQICDPMMQLLITCVLISNYQTGPWVLRPCSIVRLGVSLGDERPSGRAQDREGITRVLLTVVSNQFIINSPSFSTPALPLPPFKSSVSLYTSNRGSEVRQWI